MSTPLHGILTGSFTSDGAVKNITLPSGYDEFSMVNITDIGSTAAATPVMRAYASSSMSAGSAYYNTKTNGAATVAIETTTASGGFTFVSDSGSAALGSALTITSVSQANPAVVALASTAGLASGDVVRIYGTTAMLQIASMDFTIASLVANTSFTLAYLNSAGFAAAASAGSVRRVPFDPRYYPRRRFITGVTAASSAVITLSVTHQFTVGQLVRIYVPSGWGMTQMDGQLATITAINTTTNTITVNIDSSAYTAFAFPTSAIAATGINFPQVVPVGEAASGSYANLLDDATENQSFTGVQIGTTVQTSGKLYQWFARKGVTLS